MYCAKAVNGPYRKFHASMQKAFLSNLQVYLT